MPFTLDCPSLPCPLCGEASNRQSIGWGTLILCSRCGDFCITDDLADDVRSELGCPIKDELKRALVSHLVRKMQTRGKQPVLKEEFFRSLGARSLPSPSEAINNLLLWLGKEAKGRPGSWVAFSHPNGEVISTIGVVSDQDVDWVIRSLIKLGFADGTRSNNTSRLVLTVKGWEQVEALNTARVSSNFAFFARRFENHELDEVFHKCLSPAVKATGYELRTVTQKAGPVDAIIEDEIRRCRFLIADLTDHNNGAYWEAGFAEGLGKPVIYICRDVDKETGKPIETHFDTDHRHTVRWNLNSLEDTAKRLKAVIRNTLLGDAVQSDE